MTATHPQAPASPQPEAEAQKAVAPVGYVKQDGLATLDNWGVTTILGRPGGGYDVPVYLAAPSAGAPLPEQRQEAVAGVPKSVADALELAKDYSRLVRGEAWFHAGKTFDQLRNALLKLAAPATQAVKVPLTEEQLKKLDFCAHRDTGCKTGSWAHLMTFARAIERAHGIQLSEGERSHD